MTHAHEAGLYDITEVCSWRAAISALRRTGGQRRTFKKRWQDTSDERGSLHCMTCLPPLSQQVAGEPRKSVCAS